MPINKDKKQRLTGSVLDGKVNRTKDAVDLIWKMYSQGRISRGETMAALKQVRNHIEVAITTLHEDMLANGDENGDGE